MSDTALEDAVYEAIGKDAGDCGKGCARYSWPYSPKAIEVNGVVVGYIHDDWQGEYVTAVGRDPQIARMLNAAWTKARARRRVALEADLAEWLAECREQEKQWRDEARKALGLD